MNENQDVFIFDFMSNVIKIVMKIKEIIIKSGCIKQNKNKEINIKK
jgi:hypothetical protein